MHSRYNHGCPQNVRIHPCASIPCVSHEDMPGQGAIPESVRIGQNACVNSWIQTAVPRGCGISAQSQVIQVPTAGLPARPVAIVETVPASVTTRQITDQIKKNESDPYDPVTRFAHYFPPAPLPYVCPERLPSNEPLPRETPCIPNTRFQGSAPGR